MADYPYRPSAGSSNPSANNGETDIERRLAQPAGWLGRGGQRLWQLLALPLLVLFILPLLALFLRTSPQQFLSELANPDVLAAVGVSLRTTLISLVVILIAGTPLALLISQPRFPLKGLVNTLVDLPTVLPPAVAGVALLMAVGRRGVLGDLLGSLGITIAFTPAAVVLAQVFVAAPYFVRTAALGFGAVDAEIQQAAQLDGAGPWQLFWNISAPLARASLFGGGVMSWARALGEFGATIIFAGSFLGRTETMPMAIYLGFESNLDSALAISILLVLISFVALMAVRLAVDSAKE